MLSSMKDWLSWQQSLRKAGTVTIRSIISIPLLRLNRLRSSNRSSCLVRSYAAEADPVVTTAWLQDHLEEVTILDVRGHVDTVLVDEGVEKSTYVADYDQYLE